jgi:23S rRNA pseudouridine1911/1915/1917 synthase
MLVIAETNELLVLNKPADLITHSDGRTIESSVAEWIAEHYPELADVGEPWVSPQGESVRVCGLVHRLDRTTSGVLVAAKTNEVFSYLKGEFKARRVEKKYHAIVYGKMEGQGTIVSEIARTGTMPKRWYAKPRDANHSRAAITEWRALKSFETEGELVTYLELTPKTGRTHQLRVHLSSIGHPIVGDHLYAPEKQMLLGFIRPALHAYSISFSIGDKKQVFIAPLPNDFENAL